MPRLVIRKGEGVGKDHSVGGTCVVGRHESAHFVLGDGLASRNHFRVLTEAGAWFLEDLGSTNGTLLNGLRVKRQKLKDGDRILAGTTELEFVQKDLLQGGGHVKAMPPARGAAAPALPAPALPAPALPAAAVPAAAVPARALPASPVPARPAPAARAAPAAPPTAPAPAPAASASAAKPKIQAPIPTKKRR